jgi:hypothetical protein
MTMSKSEKKVAPICRLEAEASASSDTSASCYCAPKVIGVVGIVE